MRRYPRRGQWPALSLSFAATCPTARQYHIKSLGVFGSYIRNEQTPQSDPAVLAEFDTISQHSLFSIVGIQLALRGMPGVKVDLVLRESLKPYIGEHILDEVMMA